MLVSPEASHLNEKRVFDRLIPDDLNLLTVIVPRRAT